MMDGNIILSVAKAMEVLQILSQAESPLSLKELATRCGYPKSTVFGLLTTMRTYDVAAQTPDGKYTLGLRLFEYGRQVERSWDISLVARPYMEHLCQRTGASVMLSVSRTSAEALLRAQHMSQFTPHTITDLTALMQEIDLCRANGYAIENGEYKIGLRSISAPVYTVERKARYTVGVIGMFRSTRSDEFLAAVEQVCATASMISTALGYRKTEELL